MCTIQLKLVQILYQHRTVFMPYFILVFGTATSCVLTQLHSTPIDIVMNDAPAIDVVNK